MRNLDVVSFFAAAGEHCYDEAVTQLDHALQCAALACRARAADEVVLAALLHDVGHVAMNVPEDAEGHHGLLGAALLRPFVPEQVAWLIEHHVVAKRYLCAVDPRYAAQLSPASARSLAVQGPCVHEAERFALESEPWFADAIRIRKWDDSAKDPHASSPPLIHYRGLLERWFGPQSWPDREGIV